MTPAAERQQRKRDRQKAGLVRVEVWVPADKAQAVRDAVAAIQRGEALVTFGLPDETWIKLDVSPPGEDVQPVEDASPGPQTWFRAVSEEDYQLLQRVRK